MISFPIGQCFNCVGKSFIETGSDGQSGVVADGVQCGLTIKATKQSPSSPFSCRKSSIHLYSDTQFTRDKAQWSLNNTLMLTAPPSGLHL